MLTGFASTTTWYLCPTEQESDRNTWNEISAILTNTDKDRIGLVRNNWHEVTAHNRDLVIINGEYKCRVYRCVDKP